MPLRPIPHHLLHSVALASVSKKSGKEISTQPHFLIAVFPCAISPATSSFQIDAASRHGEVESDFSGHGLKVVKEGDNPTISGAVGKGGPAIRLDTEYGTVRLLRMGSHPPTPPAPPRSPAGDEKRAWNAPRHHRPFSGTAGRAV